MNKTEKFIYVILVFLATFVMVNRFLIPCVGIIGILFFLLVSKDFKLRTSKMFTSLLITASVVVITLGLGVIPQFSKLIDLSVGIKELLRVVVYAMVLQMMAMLKMDQRFYFNVWKTITVIIVAGAILQYIKIFDMNLFLQRIYGASKQFIYAEATDLSKFRGGSFFCNPNVFACFLVAMLANYMFTLRFTKETVLSRVFMFGLIMVGFVLSGSRTGMILGVVLIVYHLYTQSKMGLASFVKNLALITVLLLGSLWILQVVFSVDLLGLSGLRMFKVEEGLDDSFGSKLDIFGRLIGDMNLANMLIGYGPFDYAHNIELMVDFDLGYFITYFGVVGLVAYSVLLYGIYCWGNRMLPGRRMLNMSFMIITVVFGLTAGIYFNLRMFTLYMLLFLPKLIQREEGKQLA